MTQEEAELAADLAKLDLIEIKGRERLGDDGLNVFDLASIAQAAEHFRVSERMAYRRAKELGLLSYQDTGTEEMSELVLAARDKIVAFAASPLAPIKDGGVR
jgi:Zn-dependent peptidase ImmA (M78 family)